MFGKQNASFRLVLLTQMLLVTMSAISEAETRTWTYTPTGGGHEVKFEAECVAVQGTKVTLKKKDGQTASFTLANLSQEDVRYVEKMKDEFIGWTDAPGNAVTALSKAEIREWEYQTPGGHGSTKIDAEYVGVEEVNVLLKASDGKIEQVPLAYLSDSEAVEKLSQTEATGFREWTDARGVKFEARYSGIADDSVVLMTRQPMSRPSTLRSRAIAFRLFPANRLMKGTPNDQDQAKRAASEADSNRQPTCHSMDGEQSPQSGLSRVSLPIPIACVGVAELRKIDGLRVDPETWRKMPESERIGVLQAAEDRMAKAQGRPAERVYGERMTKNSYGYFRPDGRQRGIYVNTERSKFDSLPESLNTVVHEGRHAYQDHAIRTPGFRTSGEAGTAASRGCARVAEKPGAALPHHR